MILYSEGATKAQEDEANGILRDLWAVYPGHPWSVKIYEGGFFIQYLDPKLPGGFGMNFKERQFNYSASAMKRQILLGAGEWLERAHLKRGRNNEDEPVWVEGMPEKYRRKSLELQKILGPDGRPMAETAH